jgi:hypothetical protein
MAMLSMELTRDNNCKKCDFNLYADKPVDDLAVRLGPFPLSAKQLSVENNRGGASATLFESGDSNWAWVRIGKMNKTCHIRAEVR